VKAGEIIITTTLTRAVVARATVVIINVVPGAENLPMTVAGGNEVPAGVEMLAKVAIVMSILLPIISNSDIRGRKVQQMVPVTGDVER
jgi:hypothetical protein